MPLTEKNELESLRNASIQSFDYFYTQYSGKLYNFVMRVSKGDGYISEEIVQRTFIKIWETKEQINPDKSFISYLCTIAKNMLLNEYEHQAVQYIYQDYVKLKMKEVDNTTEQEIDKNLLEEYIDKLAENLPPKRREIFILSRKKGLSNKKISEQLHISESTIETQLSKAIAFMKSQLQKHYEYILIILITSATK
ncbi:MAG: RNA polymerase sigma-70 factor [Bacteroidales bacterium]|nr:RNA polymerase sigma-70 factor [Bacteroidales bacterium]MDD2612387.1 RNA polymerase sigma-70 factor [Bacteroidales bacterium]MDD4713234.1 RNA polymerase sigma-70 factor [Bacteroidales bacterium]